MRKLIVTQNVTVDGVIDMTEGWFESTGAEDPEAVEELAAAERAQRASADSVLLGRKTFEEFRGYWPARRDTDDTGVSAYLDGVTKYVLSSTLTEPGWDNSEVVRGPLAETVAELKSRPGADIVATGSLSLMPGLVSSGLVDEYRLLVYPVVLGRGARLFEGADLGRLELVEARGFSSGVSRLTYRVPVSGG